MTSPWGIDNMQERIKEQNQLQADAIREECLLYASVFNTTNGQKVLDKLQKVLNSPTWSPDNTEKYGYYREGQNDVIRHIINRVQKAKEL